MPATRPARCAWRSTHTAPDAEIIGSIDADYVVEPNWLKDLVPLFADPRVGFVQAPQDHRDGDRSVMHCAMNAEYAGFFDIGMVQRNEVNAIVMHGTMILIRRAALEAAGNWATDTIVEDTDLGLAILEHGYIAHYTNHRYGHGLLPDTFDAYKRQRQRWAYGGFQLLRKHWRRLLPRVDGLSREQKREYGIGWLNWLGSDSIGVVVALLNIIWVPVVAFANIAVPDRILTLPIIATFTVSVIHFVTLYRLRVRVSPGQMLGAVCAAMAVQWTVARAVGMGIINESVPFLRTAKGGGTRKGPDFPAFWEAVIAVLLLVGALTLVITNYKQVHEINIFAFVLVVQSLPFIAAVILATIEGTRFNSFAYWRGSRGQGGGAAAATAASSTASHRRAAKAAGREPHRGGAVRLVIPGRLRCHSGAPRSGEPGIHNHRRKSRIPARLSRSCTTGIMDSGLAPARAPE